MTSFLQTAE